MSAKIIDGSGLAKEIRANLAREAEEFRGRHGMSPGLAVVLVGEDPASAVYVRQKDKVAGELGYNSLKHNLPAETPEAELLNLVERLNEDPAVHGILVQLPLPGHIDSSKVLFAIDPAKDVDGFHPTNVGKLVIGEAELQPCTPRGVMEMLHSTGIDLAGKEAVVVGRSNIVGKPVSLMLLHDNATVTVCHSKTRDLARVVHRADVVIAAVGRPKTVTADMVKEGAVVIDVGVNREGDKLVGDVDFDAVSQKASAISPVPGGVGPMTIAMLMKNTLIAARQHSEQPVPVG